MHLPLISLLPLLTLDLTHALSSTPSPLLNSTSTNLTNAVAATGPAKWIGASPLQRNVSVVLDINYQYPRLATDGLRFLGGHMALHVAGTDADGPLQIEVVLANTIAVRIYDGTVANSHQSISSNAPDGCTRDIYLLGSTNLTNAQFIDPTAGHGLVHDVYRRQPGYLSGEHSGIHFVLNMAAALGMPSSSAFLRSFELVQQYELQPPLMTQDSLPLLLETHATSPGNGTGSNTMTVFITDLANGTANATSLPTNGAANVSLSSDIIFYPDTAEPLDLIDTTRAPLSALWATAASNGTTLAQSGHPSSDSSATLHSRMMMVQQASSSAWFRMNEQRNREEAERNDITRRAQSRAGLSPQSTRSDTVARPAPGPGSDVARLTPGEGRPNSLASALREGPPDLIRDSAYGRGTGGLAAEGAEVAEKAGEKVAVEASRVGVVVEGGVSRYLEFGAMGEAGGMANAFSFFAGVVYIIVDLAQGDYVQAATTALGIVLAMPIGAAVEVAAAAMGLIPGIGMVVSALISIGVGLILPGLLKAQGHTHFNNQRRDVDLASVTDVQGIVQAAIFGDPTVTGNEKCRQGVQGHPANPNCTVLYGPEIIASAFGWNSFDAVVFMLQVPSPQPDQAPPSHKIRY